MKFLKDIYKLLMYVIEKVGILMSTVIITLIFLLLGVYAFFFRLIYIFIHNKKQKSYWIENLEESQSFEESKYQF